MNVLLETQGFDLTPAIQTHVHSQLDFHLSNFGAHIIGVSMFLRDINGPKGGPDKKVLLQVQLPSNRSVTIERTRADLYQAITHAARQSKRAVTRALSKHRRMEKMKLRELRQFPPV